MNGVGRVYVHLGRYADAAPRFERALAIRERGLGSDHPYLAESLSGLADVRVRQDRRKEARALYERALALKERIASPDHPSVAKVRAALNALS